MKHEIVFLGKTKDGFIQEGIEEYQSRLTHYTNIQITILKDKSSGKGVRGAIESQGQQMLNSVAQGAVIVALDSRGEQFTSEALSKKITTWELSSVKQVTYLIGGPEGISDTILQSAQLVLSFSKMTFTHDMVRMLLVEQLYRAYTIKNGERYHK
ncbi:MAG: 23S rRNA (pseudouridine1915-N3)-methyltransferase [Desulforhopalus sp.]|jgi:23S rRNA (pseudouridine1915-N3)-methyltransferase